MKGLAQYLIQRLGVIMIDTLILSPRLGFTVAPIRRRVASEAIMVTAGWPQSGGPSARRRRSQAKDASAF